MTHLELYEGILYETDKVKAPVFYVEHYNYVINKAIMRFIRKAYGLSDDEAKPVVSQEEIDGIRVLEKEYTAHLKPTSGELALKDAVFTLPGDYLHLRSCVAFFEPSEAIKACFKTGTRKVRRCHRFTGNLHNATSDDYYSRPSTEQVYVQQTGSKVKILAGTATDWLLEKVEGLYVRKPEEVKLEEDANQNIIPASNKVSEFPQEICDQIIDEAVTILLEIWGNPRLRNQLSIKNNS
jgi:hypothetical protein